MEEGEKLQKELNDIGAEIARVSALAESAKDAEDKRYFRETALMLRKKELMLLEVRASAAGLGVGSAAGTGAAAGAGTAQAGDAGAAAGLGVGSAAGAGTAAGQHNQAALVPDTSAAYFRRVMAAQFPDSGSTSGDNGGLLGMRHRQFYLDQPLGALLPVSSAAQEAILHDSDLLKYVAVEPDGGSIRTFGQMVTNALMGWHDVQLASSETATSFKTQLLVDIPLSYALGRLGLHFRIDRNAADPSGATTKRLRPDFLCWIRNALLLKGEEKANESALQGPGWRPAGNGPGTIPGNANKQTTWSG